MSKLLNPAIPEELGIPNPGVKARHRISKYRMKQTEMPEEEMMDIIKGNMKASLSSYIMEHFDDGLKEVEGFEEFREFETELLVFTPENFDNVVKKIIMDMPYSLLQLIRAGV